MYRKKWFQQNPERMRAGKKYVTEQITDDLTPSGAIFIALSLHSIQVFSILHVLPCHPSSTPTPTITVQNKGEHAPCTTSFLSIIASHVRTQYL